MDKASTRTIMDNFDYLLDRYTHAESFRAGESWVVNVLDDCDSVEGVKHPVRVRLMLRRDCRTCEKVLYRYVTRFAVISSYQLGILCSNGLLQAEWIHHQTMEESAHYFLLSDDHEMEELSPGWQCWKCSRLPGGGRWRNHQK